MSGRSVRSALTRHGNNNGIDMNAVLLLAGDKEVSLNQKRKIASLKKARGTSFYSDLLFALTLRHYPPAHAKRLWDAILKHRNWLTDQVGRRVLVAVAAMDYMATVTKEIDNPVFVSEFRFSKIVAVALTDGLTGLYDHATLKRSLANEIERHIRYGNDVCFVMIDVDHFKKFNDDYGHQKGDEILVEIGRILEEESRGVDVCARYGGEEFAMLLPQTSLEEGMEIAERVRNHIEQSFASCGNVTVSLGVSACPDHAREEGSLIRKADKALYRAKKDGRNRVVSAGKQRTA